MEAKGRDLIFIKRIEGDGSKVAAITKDLKKVEQGETFKLSCLSITNGTYIASGMNTYIVKLKDSVKNTIIIKGKLESIFRNNRYRFREFGEYMVDNIITEIIIMHKKDVVNANLEGIKIMRDTLSTLEAEEMANKYYEDNFEK